MFSSTSSLKKLLAMSQEEKDMISCTMDVFEQNGIHSVPMRNQIKVLGTQNLMTLLRISENNNFIHSILDNDPFLNFIWIKIAKKIGNPESAFISRDEKLTVSVFDQLKGAILMSEYNKYKMGQEQPALEILNKACELNIYAALIERLNFYNKYIDEHLPVSAHRETIETYTQCIVRDTVKFCNLYGAMAHIDSAFVLFRLASNYMKQDDYKLMVDHFFIPAAANQFSWIDKYHAKDCPQPVVLFASAIEHLYMAKLLEDDPLSKNVSEKLFQGKGLLTGFEDSYADAKELERKIKAELIRLGIPLVDSFCDISLKAAQSVIKKNAKLSQLQNNF